MSEKLVPEEISCGDQVFSIAFHAKTNVLAAALIDGSIELWQYGVEASSNKMLLKNTSHTSSCRGVEFSADGEKLFSISSDRSMQAIDGSGKQVLYYNKAHTHPINRLHVVSENTVSTGDDAGEIKLWDIRVGTEAAMTWHVHEDFVSGLTYDSDRNTLLSVSGDATLGVYDLKSDKVFYRSDDQESELNCVQVIKNGRKVACGTQDGVTLLFSWDRWGDCSDRYPGHPEGVDCMLKIDESTVLTGSSDGMIRVVALQPNKILGIVGDHEEFPVEGLSLSADRQLLGSYAHDNVVRFWDVSMFAEDDGEEFDDDEDDYDDDEPAMAAIAEGGAVGVNVASKKKSRSNKGSGSGSGNGKLGVDNGVGGEAEADMEAEAEGDSEGDWEDAEDDDDAEDDYEEEMEMSDSESSPDDGGGSDDDSDEDSNGPTGKGPKSLPTTAEKFYADL